MTLQVPYQSRLPSERPVTHLTDVVPLPEMRDEMLPQILDVSERPVAHLTDVRFHVSVGEEMRVEIRHPSETLATRLASEEIPRDVSETVIPQIRLTSERLIALITGMRHCRVSHDMPHQMRSPSKRLATSLAFMELFPAVCGKMVLQICFLSVRLATCLANMGFFACVSEDVSL